MSYLLTIGRDKNVGVEPRLDDFPAPESMFDRERGLQIRFDVGNNPFFFEWRPCDYRN